ncbi:MAG TPA: PAS domain S-box protein, partial [Dissulfurispiraceae bacterium]|nr:PAS domain S-box protein [Dissulfurispiraceae bacterium]
GNADRTASSILGVPLNNLPGSDFHLHLHPVSVVAFDDFIKRVFASGQRETCDVQLRRNVGEGIHAEIAGIAIRDRRRKRRRLRAAIIERKQSDELRLSEERFRSLSDSSPIGIFQTDTKGLCLYTNARWRELSGLAPEDCLGEGWVNAIHPEDRHRVSEEWNRSVTEGRDFSLPFRFRSPEGTVRWVHARAAPIRTADGKIVGYVGTDEDITERKKAEDALWESRRVLQLVLDTIPVRVFWKDRESRYLGCNRTFLKDAGLSSQEEITGKNDFELAWRDEAEIYRADDRLVMEKELPKLAYEEPQTFQSGMRGWLRTSKVPLHDETGTVIGVLGTYEDITERKLAEARQVQLIKDLERANRELDEFAHIVSHDLKAPLRAIASLADWIVAEYADRLDDQGREKMMILMNRVIRLHDLVDAVLRYSRAVRGSEEPSEVDLNRVIPSIIDMLSPPTHITIRVEGEMPRIICDRTRIEQVFQNLLSNALEFMDKRRGDIRIRCSSENDHWKFSVSDNGPGIEERDLFRIFRIFETSGSHDDAGSTGIGLAVVKKIVEMHGGSVWAESRLGSGSAFFFTFPKSSSNSHGLWGLT